MRAHSFMTKTIGILAATATALTMMAGIAAADPTSDPTETGSSTAPQRKIHTPLTPDTSGSERSLSAQAVDPAVTRLNLYRSRVKAAPIVEDANLLAALRAHANYLELNRNVANLNPAEEVQGRPGYTAAGAAIAPFTLAASGVASNMAALNLWMMDPWERSARLLHPLTNGMVFTRTTTFIVAAVNFNNAAQQNWPQVYPGAQNQAEMVFNSTSASYYSSKCSQKPSAWGYPISAQWDHQTLGAVSNVRASLYRDGVPVPFCLLTDRTHLDIDAQVVLMPTAPLVPGSYYTGSVTGTAVKKAGGTQAISASISFTTAAQTKVWGDQSGDNIGDLLGIHNDGNLRIYKGRAPGVFGTNWIVGGGWGTFTWFSHTPDINGDGRDDLIGRRSDGNLYLYYGQGMGSYGGARQVGKNWNGLDNITVVGDMNGDGKPEVVGVGNNGVNQGKLFRYTLGTDGFTGTTQIGKGWNNIKYMTSLGSFNTNDSTADIIAVGTDGTLHVYYTRNGQIVQAAQVGRGWGNFTALLSPGDLNGDGHPDLVGRNSAGTLYSYVNQRGSFSAGRQAGTGWNGFRLFG